MKETTLDGVVGLILLISDVEESRILLLPEFFFFLPSYL
jgi:hypothetical protein